MAKKSVQKSDHRWIEFKDIKPNPHRDLKNLPLIEEKVSALEESIHETGFWDNVVVREVAKGNFELAYGHHRVEAAKRAGLTGAYFIVKSLSDGKMIAMMARENAEVYGNDIRSTLESVRATINAYAAGKMGKELVPPKDTNKILIRHAPSFVPGKEPCANLAQRPYSASTVARFLGYTKKRKEVVDSNDEPTPTVTVAFQLLELQEREKFDILGFLETKRRKDGVIPIYTLEEALRVHLNKKTSAIERRQVAAKEAEIAAQTAKYERALAEATAKSATAELEHKLKEAAAAAKAGAPGAAKLEAERIVAKVEAEKVQAQKVKAAKAAEKAALKAAFKSAKSLREAEQTAEEKKTSQHESLAQKLKEEIDTVLSSGDSLYEELKAWKINPRTTDKQRASMAAALYNLSGRVESFNVHVSKPHTKKGEK